MDKNQLIKTLPLFLVLALLLNGGCSLQKPPCIGCEKKSPCAGSCSGKSCCKKSCKESGCPFEACFKKAPFCALKNREKLALTDEQVEKIKTFTLMSKEGFLKDMEEFKKIDDEIKIKLDADELNVEEVNVLVDKKFDLIKGKIKASVKSHSEFLSILTPEQKTKFKEIKEECQKSGCSCSEGKCPFEKNKEASESEDESEEEID